MEERFNTWTIAPRYTDTVAALVARLAESILGDDWRDCLKTLDSLYIIVAPRWIKKNKQEKEEFRVKLWRLEKLGDHLNQPQYEYEIRELAEQMMALIAWYMTSTRS